MTAGRRLMPGENAKIDMINQYVADARSGDPIRKEEGLSALLDLFHPLILKICSKWSKYFQDNYHRTMPFDTLVAEAQMWFIQYTLEKYILDGAATYNKFISDHLDQRVRYIYECELKYFSRHIFPDPDKNKYVSDNDRAPMLEYVIYNYTTPDDSDSIENRVIDKQDTRNRRILAHAILFLISNKRYFNQREEKIFMECVMGDKTHVAMARELGISRTRVSQIIDKVRQKLYTHMTEDKGIRRLVYKCL